MNDLLTRGSRLVAAAALCGAFAVGSAQATNWDQLNSSGSNWNGQQASGNTNAGGNANAGANANGAANGNAGTEIASAFQQLGMDQNRATCYGKVLSQQLSPEDQQEAAQLVESASDGDEVRANVMNAGPTMVGAFSAANTSCPEGSNG